MSTDAVPGSPVDAVVSSFYCCSAGLDATEPSLMQACPVTYSWHAATNQCIKAFVTEMDSNEAALGGTIVEASECCEARVATNPPNTELEPACQACALTQLKTLSFPPRDQEWPTS